AVTSPYITAGDAELWGTPDSEGVYNVQITVTDAEGKTTTQTFPYAVRAMHVRGSDMLPAGTRGIPYYSKLRVLGGNASSYTTGIVGGSLPAGLFLNTSANDVGGTPTENGNFSVDILYTDGSGKTFRRRHFPNISGGTS